jgi:hypothetical protein
MIIYYKCNVVLLIMEPVKYVYDTVDGKRVSAPEFINIAYNFARRESHFGTNMIVH